MTIVKDSIIEQLQPLTLPIKQHFVDDFSGTVLDTFAWTQSTYTGAPVPVIDDSVNGGLKISTGSSAGGSTTLHMQDFDQFSPTGSVNIMVYKPNQTTNTRFFIGLGTPKSNNGNASESYHSSTESYYMQRTAGGGETKIATDIALDTNFHTHKIENGSAKIHYSIDGVLKTTAVVGSAASSVYAFQPIADLYNQAVATDSSYNITYFEAWNT